MSRPCATGAWCSPHEAGCCPQGLCGPAQCSVGWAAVGRAVCWHLPRDHEKGSSGLALLYVPDLVMPILNYIPVGFGCQPNCKPLRVKEYFYILRQRFLITKRAAASKTSRSSQQRCSYLDEYMEICKRRPCHGWQQNRTGIPSLLNQISCNQRIIFSFLLHSLLISAWLAAASHCRFCCWLWNLAWYHHLPASGLKTATQLMFDLTHWWWPAPAKELWSWTHGMEANGRCGQHCSLKLDSGLREGLG